MNPIRKLKNGGYNLHLTFSEAYVFRNLLKKQCDEYTEIYGNGRLKTVQDRFLEYFNEALTFDEMLDKKNLKR